MKIIIIAFVWLFVSSSFAEIVLDESAFTQRYAKAMNIREDGVRADIKGRLEVEMTYSNGETSTAYLDNAYMNYRSSPGELDAIINAYINALTKSSSDVKSNIEKEHIFPVIKDRGYMEQITKLMNHSSKGELPFYYEKLNDEKAKSAHLAMNIAYKDVKIWLAKQAPELPKEKKCLN